MAALAEITLVTADLEAGEWDDGLARCDRLTETLGRVGRPEDLATVDVTRGQLLTRLDRAVEAIDVLAAVERRLPEGSIELANARFALANALGAASNNDAALDMLDAAQATFAAQGRGLDVGLCRANRVKALVELGQLDRAEVELVAARQALAHYDVRDQLAALDTHEAVLRQAQGKLAGSRPFSDGFPDEDDSVEAAYARMATSVTALDTQDFPTAIAWGERAAARFEELQMPVPLPRRSTTWRWPG